MEKDVVLRKRKPGQFRSTVKRVGVKCGIVIGVTALVGGTLGGAALGIYALATLPPPPASASINVVNNVTQSDSAVNVRITNNTKFPENVTFGLYGEQLTAANINNNDCPLVAVYPKLDPTSGASVARNTNIVDMGTVAPHATKSVTTYLANTYQGNGQVSLYVNGKGRQDIIFGGLPDCG